MFEVIARCGNYYGIIDSDDKVVEWEFDTTLFDYTNNGVEINGVSEGQITVNPLYYIPYAEVTAPLTDKENSEKRCIFDIAENIRKGNRNLAEFTAVNKKYKLRFICPLAEGSVVSLSKYSFTADISGYFVKLSNGICTILPIDIFNALFGGIIDLSIYDLRG